MFNALWCMGYYRITLALAVGLLFAKVVARAKHQHAHGCVILNRAAISTALKHYG